MVVGQLLITPRRDLYSAARPSRGNGLIRMWYGIFSMCWCSASPVLVAEWLTHLAAMCCRAWRAQWPGFDTARARPPTKELFLIIPVHMMNREIIPGNKKGSTVSSISCDRCRHLDLAVSSLPAAPTWVEVNRLGWPLAGVIYSAS